MALAIVRQLDDFWRNAGEQDLTFLKARVQLAKLPAFKTFTGFGSRADEARFLYSRIQQATPYFSEISLIAIGGTAGRCRLGFAQAEGIGFWTLRNTSCLTPDIT